MIINSNFLVLKQDKRFYLENIFIKLQGKMYAMNIMIIMILIIINYFKNNLNFFNI